MGTARYRIALRPYGPKKKQFFVNYKTVLGREEALREPVGKNFGEGVVSGRISMGRAQVEIRQIPTKFFSAGIGDIDRAGFSALFYAAQGWPDQHIRPTMQP